MKIGSRLLDGPGTPSLESVQELRLMALLKDLVSMAEACWATGVSTLSDYVR